MTLYQYIFLLQTSAEDSVDALAGKIIGTFVGLGVGLGLSIWFIRKRMVANNVPIETAPCPRCGLDRAVPVGYSWWGGALGPKILNHVKCLHCSATFNSKTGKSNNVGITVYIVVSTILVAIGLWKFLF